MAWGLDAGKDTERPVFLLFWDPLSPDAIKTGTPRDAMRVSNEVSTEAGMLVSSAPQETETTSLFFPAAAIAA